MPYSIVYSFFKFYYAFFHSWCILLWDNIRLGRVKMEIFPNSRPFAGQLSGLRCCPQVSWRLARRMYGRVAGRKNCLTDYSQTSLLLLDFLLIPSTFLCRHPMIKPRNKQDPSSHSYLCYDALLQLTAEKIGSLGLCYLKMWQARKCYGPLVLLLNLILNENPFSCYWSNCRVFAANTWRIYFSMTLTHCSWCAGWWRPRFLRYWYSWQSRYQSYLCSTVLIKPR